MLGVSEFFVGYCQKIFQTQGLEGIKLGYKGSQGYFTERQTDVVVEWLKKKESWNLDKIIKFLFEFFTKEHKFDLPKIHQYTYT
jgi:putative transposase